MIENAQKRSIDEIITFCRNVEKCKSILEKSKEKKSKIKKKNKRKGIPSFSQSQKEKLYKRVRQYCKKFPLLTIWIEKKTVGVKPKPIPTSNKVSIMLPKDKDNLGNAEDDNEAYIEIEDKELNEKTEDNMQNVNLEDVIIEIEKNSAEDEPIKNEKEKENGSECEIEKEIENEIENENENEKESENEKEVENENNRIEDDSEMENTEEEMIVERNEGRDDNENSHDENAEIGELVALSSEGHNKIHSPNSPLPITHRQQSDNTLHLSNQQQQEQ